MRSETYTTPGPVRLDLELPYGRIEIETVPGDETHVELEALTPPVREMVENARIESNKRGDRYEVVVDVQGRHGFWISFDRHPPDMSLRVTCPFGAELDIRTKSADVDARGTYSSLDVKTASGDVYVQEATGDVAAKSASGDVRVEMVGGKLEMNSASGDLRVDTIAGEASVQLVSGDLYIREAGESVRANTVSGDQRLETVGEGRHDLRAISGDINVGVRRGARLFVDANTVSGGTSSDFELSDAPAGDGESEGPLVEIFAKTVSGDVRIERA
jgi:DUF4097 and DUF4098 domain-containing protein YvlB